MPEPIGNPSPPTGLSRLFWRAPIWLYRLGLGGILGKRFLLLIHTGRKSGLTRQTVLEVVNYDPPTETYIVAAGFGTRSDWCQNIIKTPQAMIQVGRNQTAVTARQLLPEAAGQALVDYAQRNPQAAKGLMRLCGYRVDGSERDYYLLGRDVIPFFALEPR